MKSDKCYIEIGKTLSLIQTADHSFKAVLRMAFPGADVLNEEVWEKNKQKLGKATLGRLIRILQERVELHESFETVLCSYLADRNNFVHDWDEIDGWDTDQEAMTFLNRLQKQSASIAMILFLIHKQWTEQTGIVKHPNGYTRSMMPGSAWEGFRGA